MTLTCPNCGEDMECMHCESAGFSMHEAGAFLLSTLRLGCKSMSQPRALWGMTPWNDFGLPKFTDFVYACFHSHAPTAELLESVAQAPGHVHIISNRCCVDDSLPMMPDYEYLDWGIWSPERRMRIWRDYSPADRGVNDGTAT